MDSAGGRRIDPPSRVLVFVVPPVPHRGLPMCDSHSGSRSRLRHRHSIAQLRRSVAMTQATAGTLRELDGDEEKQNLGKGTGGTGHTTLLFLINRSASIRIANSQPVY